MLDVPILMLDVSILDTRRGPVGTGLSTGTAGAAGEKGPPGNEPHAGNGAFGVRAPSANAGAWQPRAALQRSESTSPRVHFSDWARGAVGTRGFKVSNRRLGTSPAHLCNASPLKE